MFGKKKIYGDIPKSVLVEDLLRITAKYKAVTVTRAVYKARGRFAVRQFYAKFGSWNAALVSAGLMTWSNSCVTKKEPREAGYKLRLAVFSRDNFKCVLCGASPASDPSAVLHIDHIVPYSAGGKTEIENLRTLCSKCNLGKGAD